MGCGTSSSQVVDQTDGEEEVHVETKPTCQEADGEQDDAVVDLGAETPSTRPKRPALKQVRSLGRDSMRPTLLKRMGSRDRAISAPVRRSSKLIQAPEIKLIRSVHEALSNPEWKAAGSIKPGESYSKKAKIIRQIGAPEMMLLPAKTLATLRRLPRSSEARQYLVPLDSLDERTDRIFMVSHRWLRPEQDLPDDEDDSKALALMNFAMWFSVWYHPGRNVFFWMDFCSVDQDDPKPGIISLPLYVAACGGMVYFDTPDADARAWCRVERILGFAFQEAGAAPYIIQKGFTCLEPPETPGPREEMKRAGEAAMMRSQRLLSNPLDGILTHDDDWELVRRLTALSQTIQVIWESRSNTAAGTELEFGRTVVNGRELKNISSEDASQAVSRIGPNPFMRTPTLTERQLPVDENSGT